MNCDQAGAILKEYLRDNSDLSTHDPEKITGYFECRKLKKEEFLFEQGKRFPHLAATVPLKYLASYLQINQSTLSRFRRKD